MDSKNKISKLFGAFILILALTFSTSSYADSSSSDEASFKGDSSSDSNGGDSIPLDGGLSVLLLGAAAFGVKKLRDTKK